MVSAAIGPAYTCPTLSPGMVEIGNWMPPCMVVTYTSRCVSSTISAPSVPTISIQVDEKLGYAGGSTHPAPIVNADPSSMVTIIQTQSGTLYCGPMILRTSCAYTRTGLRGA